MNFHQLWPNGKRFDILCSMSLSWTLELVWTPTHHPTTTTNFSRTSRQSRRLRFGIGDYGRKPLMVDNLWWKTTFAGRQPLLEDNLCRKTIFAGIRPLIGRRPLLECTFDGRQPLQENKEDTFGGRLPFMGGDLWWEKPLDERQPLMKYQEDIETERSTIFFGPQIFFGLKLFFRPKIF